MYIVLPLLFFCNEKARHMRLTHNIFSQLNPLGFRPSFISCRLLARIDERKELIWKGLRAITLLRFMFMYNCHDRRKLLFSR